MKKIVVFICTFVFFLFSCKKNDVSPEQKVADQRKADSTYNSNITPGIGNIFIEEKLNPGAFNQLVFKLSFNGDTLAGYGKINSNGALEYLNSLVLAKKGTNELFVQEFYPDVSKGRMYTMVNNVKSNMVFEVSHISKTKVFTSMLDMDWNSGNFKLLKQSYFEEGKEVANFSSVRVGREYDPRVYNCIEPQPASDIDKQLENQMDYLICGLWMDSYDGAFPQIKIIEKTIEFLKQSSEYRNKEDELNLFQKMHDEVSSILKSINDKVSGYKFENTKLYGLLKFLEDRINQLKGKAPLEVLLVPLEIASDADYDEVIDNEIKLTFTITEKSTGLPYTKSPVAVDFALVKTNTADDDYGTTTVYSSIVNGLVVFKYDPSKIEELRSFSTVDVRFAFTKDNWNPQASREITLKWVQPKVVLQDGSAIPSTLVYTNDETKNFKLVNNDGRAIQVNYNDVTLNNLSNNSIGYTMLKGTNGFSLKFSTGETTTQTGSFDLYYKGKLLQHINISISDLMELYRASIAENSSDVGGNWICDNYFSGVFGVRQYKRFMPDGSVLLVKNEHADGTIEDFGTGRYQESWSVVKDNEGYHLRVSGARTYYPYVLKYPVTYMLGGTSNSEYIYTRR